MKKKTTEEFVKESKLVHGDKYDYSKVEYINKKTPVCIICKKHGEFWQLPQVHTHGHGCPKCKTEVNKYGGRLTTEEFIEKAKKVHGDKYDYSKVEYANESVKVCILCHEHGEFYQTPRDHMCGKGCAKCYRKKQSITQLSNTFSFIEKAKKIHGDKYDYSKVEYINSKTPVIIICPEHGEFLQTPNNHLNGHGCYVCKQSLIEKEVKTILEKYSIKYVKEKTFEWLRNKSLLKLDFYLPDYDIAIECQGTQHFFSNEYFGGKDDFELTIERDNIKRKSCSDHSIKILYYANYKYDFPYHVITTEEELLKEIKN